MPNGKTDHGPWQGRLRYIGFLILILGVTIAITEILWLRFSFAQHNLVMLYVLSVLIISCTSPGYAYGLVAAGVSALACDFLIVSPRLDFSFTSGSPMTLVTLLAITMIASSMASRLREQSKRAQNQQQHFEILYEINRELLSARSIQAIVTLINKSLAEHVDRPVVFYTDDPLSGSQGFCAVQPDTPPVRASLLAEAEFSKVHRLFQSPAQLPADASYMSPVYYLPLLTEDRVTGVIGIDCREGQISEDELSYIHTLAGQVALAFELQRLSDLRERLTVEAEREKTRAILLRSISHDFRTPVATIRGASAAMREHPDLPAATREKLLRDIEEYADWLIRLVENVLTITRLSGESVQITKASEAAEEVVSAAVSIVRKRYPGGRINVVIPDALLLVPMDATLIVQVLINLLENAIKNSPAGVQVLMRLEQQGQHAVFQVADEGSGIRPERLDRLFQPYGPSTKQKADVHRENGIGLSICKTIIDAHNGTIEGHNRESGGAVFSFSLPMEDASNGV